MENYEVQDGSSELRLEILNKNGIVKKRTKEMVAKINELLDRDIETILGSTLKNHKISRNDIVLSDDKSPTVTNEDKDR